MASATYYAFTGVLYPKEDPIHERALKTIISFSSMWGWKYFYINHDKDVYEEDKLDEDNNLIHSKGDIKKEHVHYVVVTERRSKNTICQRLGLNKKYDKECSGVGNLKQILKYLVHEDDINKHRYYDSEVSSNVNYREYTDGLSINKLDDEFIGDFLNMMEEMVFSDVDINFINIVQWSKKWGGMSWIKRNHQYVSKLMEEYKIMQVRYRSKNSKVDIEF